MKRAFVLVMLNILMNSILKVNCVTLLPHGPANPNDIQLVSEDESTEEITTLVPFTFYGITYDSIWVIVKYYTFSKIPKLIVIQVVCVLLFRLYSYLFRVTIFIRNNGLL